MNVIPLFVTLIQYFGFLLLYYFSNLEQDKEIFLVELRTLGSLNQYSINNPKPEMT